MGVPFLYEIPDTFDVSGEELSFGRKYKDDTVDVGWPAVVRDALRHTKGRVDYKYDGKKLGGVAEGIGRMLKMHELYVGKFMNSTCLDRSIGKSRKHIKSKCGFFKWRDPRNRRASLHREFNITHHRDQKKKAHTVTKVRISSDRIPKEGNHRRLNQLIDSNTHRSQNIRHDDTREIRSETEERVYPHRRDRYSHERIHAGHRKDRPTRPRLKRTASYFAALPEIRAKSVSYGIKAPASMLLLPVFHQIYSARNTIEKKIDDVPGAGGFKFLQVVRDGRDISFSKNQSPVEKFYDLYKRGKYSRSHSYEGPAMELWNDWNVQAHNWLRLHDQQKETPLNTASLLDHATVRVEDTMSEDISVRFSAFKSIASFVGSTLTDEEICCVANKDRSKRIGKQGKDGAATTYGKWKEKLKEKPELSKELHKVGSEGLKLFGYEPPQSILDCKGSHGNYVCEHRPDMCDDLPIKSNFIRGVLRMCEVFPKECADMGNLKME
eukprot:CAMPEP_0194309022 /NCGR_PEP_ID=MMETSP0171-20130528/5989_1 /TAXON_ID=218684 /ORGANISM="Corethron pennatum, Strain L29A3" /LENGTH=493 /DNA_ID=CAMNT_0039061981 /DNA_START=373 /DNA_END=1851 /DNA_ORIENTATION=-